MKAVWQTVYSVLLALFATGADAMLSAAQGGMDAAEFGVEFLVFALLARLLGFGTNALAKLKKP